MKKKHINDLRNKTAAELTKLAADLLLEMSKAQMALATRKTKNTNLAGNLKRQLATVLSIKREMELYAKS